MFFEHRKLIRVPCFLVAGEMRYHDYIMTEHSQRMASVHGVEHSQARYDLANMAVLSAQVIAWASLLVAMTHTSHWLLLIVEIYFFCIMMQGVFSMMHEGFHGHCHRSERINYAMCWLASTLFGASATFIKVNHLGHHVRNRTEAEMVDYVTKNESRLKKTIAYYLAIVGGIWIGACVGSIAMTLVPSSLLGKLQKRSAANTYAAALGDFSEKDIRAIRIEVITGLLFWAAAWLLLGFNITGVLLAYAAFAFSWSSLQWIYHVRTPLDVVEGTYNLRSSRLVRWFFLNFNYNLTHHRDPGLRWQLLHRATDLKETRPFWRTWLAIAKPPAPLPEEPHFQKTYY